jgi:hypothetical protein
MHRIQVPADASWQGMKVALEVKGSGGISLVSTEGSKASTTLPGKVEKVIRPHPGSGEPEKAQIAVEGADHLYREIRVPNTLTDAHGQKVKLKEGAEVEVKIEVDPVVHQNGA